MERKTSIGEIGEDLAVKFLKNKKYRILGRNLEIPAGELDIVARDPQGVLVFVEVKALRGSEIFKPEDHFNTEKQNKLRLLSQHFVNKYPHYADERLGWRIDLLAITLADPLEPDFEKLSVVNHYEQVI